ncbi:hypothetical protein DCC79_02070 [bacterium]|nr:MAG: hypothetical protein DCC79_02070 [bacterium]
MPVRGHRAWAGRVALAVLGSFAGVGTTSPSLAGAAPRWVRHPVAGRAVVDVAVDAGGGVWARALAAPGSGWRSLGDPVVGIDKGGKVRARGTLSTIVAQGHTGVVRTGTVEDLWAVDGAGRVWVGARFHDGARWTVVGRDESGPDGATRLEARAILDGTGAAWVPFATASACPGTDPCDARGLAGFDARGRLGSVTFEPLYEADAFGLADVHLRAGNAAAPWAAARARIYALPETTGTPYPLLGPPPNPGDLRNAGYAGAAARRADGGLDVFTWVERQVQTGVTYHVFRNRLDPDGSWEAPDDLSAGPLFEGRVKTTRPAAAAWSPPDAAGGAPAALWLASSAGEVARWRDGVWDVRFTGPEIGLTAGARIRDLAVGPDGTLWLAADDGLHSYGALDPIEGEDRRVLLPYVAARR